VKKIHEFYEVLLFNVKSLRTLESLNKLDAAVRFTFNKLGVIKNELEMIDDQWSEWSLTVIKRREKNRDYFTPNVVIATRRPPVVVCFAKAPITMQSLVIRS